MDKELASAKNGVYAFLIHGMVHHSIGQLLPREGQPRAFAQIYIHDGTSKAELEYSQQYLGERSLPELRGLQDMMHNHNPFVSFFKHGIEVMAQHGAADIRMTIRAEGLPDPRRYNAPTAPKMLLSCLEMAIQSIKPTETSYYMPATRVVEYSNTSVRPTVLTTHCTT